MILKRNDFITTYGRTPNTHFRFPYLCSKSAMMNAFVSKIGLVALFIIQCYFVKAHVALDYPIGGETFIVNEPLTIQWHVVVPHNTLNWDLYYSPDGGVTWDTIQLDIPTSQLSYDWVVPDQPTAQGRVRVIQDNTDQNYLDISMNFSILPNTNPPTLDAPANDTVIECNTGNQAAAIQAWLDNHGGASATNFCGDLVWTNDFPGLSNECGGTGSALVTFTAADDCGLTMTNATLTVVDTDAPDISVFPTDVFVETDGQGNIADLNNWLSTHGGAQASDACSNVNWSNNYSGLTDDCGATGSAAVLFTVTDACGNGISAVAHFTIADHIAPTIQIPAHDTTITCSVSNQQMHIQHWLDTHGGAQAYDLGGDVIWAHNYSGLSDGCGSTGSATVVFTATDECGNSITTSAMLTIEDHVAPTISTPSQNITLECSVINQQSEIQHWLDIHGGAQATDGCSNVTWTNNYSGLSDGCGASGIANVIFTATDECGNSSTTVASLTIEDTSLTTIENIAIDTTILCGIGDQATVIENWLNHRGGANASDLCGSVNWTNNFPALTDTCGPIGSHNVIFTATDECGNAASVQANLTIQDSLPTSVSKAERFDFRIYPNPASETLNIVYDKNEVGNVLVNLFDSCGKALWSEKFVMNEISIPLDDYASGFYFLQISTAKGTYARKILVRNNH